MEYYIVYILLFVLLLYVTEVLAYFWHRTAAHSPYINPVSKTHRYHHIDINDLAHYDFIYLLVLLTFYLIFIFYLYNKDIINLTIASLLFFPVCLMLIYNWYIHSAFHIENHWLNKYEWFQRDKKLHLLHHVNNDKNYGIATHFADTLFNTYIFC